MNELQKLKQSIYAKRRPNGLAEIRQRFDEYEKSLVPLRPVLELLGLWIVIVVRVWG